MYSRERRLSLFAVAAIAATGVIAVIITVPRGSGQPFPRFTKLTPTLRMPVVGDALSIGWSHDGQLLATSSYDWADITIWNARTGTAIK